MEIIILQEHAQGKYICLLVNGKAYKCYLITHEGEPKLFFIREKKLVPLQQLTKLFKPAKKQNSFEDQTIITSPLQGCLTKLLVSPGQAITPGQTVAIIESMKMENEIKAAIAAIIQTIPISQGSVVQKNQVLMTLIPVTLAD